jgi:molecular chaperone DnaK (HSP70)
MYNNLLKRGIRIMVYGIDLGTTYSLIGSGDKLYSDLVASAVNLETKESEPTAVILAKQEPDTT